LHADRSAWATGLVVKHKTATGINQANKLRIAATRFSQHVSLFISSSFSIKDSPGFNRKPIRLQLQNGSASLLGLPALQSKTH